MRNLGLYALLLMTPFFALKGQEAEQFTLQIHEVNVLARHGDYEQALEKANAIVAANPERARAYKLRANIHFAMHNYELALKDFDHVVSLVPDSANAHLDRAIVLDAIAKYDVAKKEVGQAIAIKPDSFFADQVRQVIDVDSGAVKSKKRPFKTKG